MSYTNSSNLLRHILLAVLRRQQRLPRR